MTSHKGLSLPKEQILVENKHWPSTQGCSLLVITGGKTTKKSSIIFLSREILKYLVQFVFVIFLDHT